jgi:WXG100 family type VII secretion target
MTVPGIGFDATPDDIDGVGTKCDTTATSLDGELATLRGYVAELAGYWLGATSVAFANVMTEYDSKAKQLTQALRDIGAGLHMNANNYRLGEGANTQTVTSIVV